MTWNITEKPVKLAVSRKAVSLTSFNQVQSYLDMGWEVRHMHVTQSDYARCKYHFILERIKDEDNDT